MKKGRFSEEQMVKILREAERMPIAEVAKKRGVSEQMIYVWRRRFGKMEVAGTDDRPGVGGQQHLDFFQKIVIIRSALFSPEEGAAHAIEPSVRG